jgi:2-polyprenyl-3-methyl-5-hydroxy-6-metoxy-1,4-benzoquinol methylase
MREFVRMNLVERDKWILDKCSHKRILHVGCTDFPLTREKAQQGRLLHQSLNNVCESVLGVDISENSLQIMRDEFNISNIRFGDAEHLCNFVENEKYDIILAADVVEHLDNPGLFFKNAAQLIGKGCCSRIIITVPMAFSIKRFGSLFLNHDEHPHPDHVAYYSPSCLKQIALRNNLHICENVAFLWKNPTRKNYICNGIAWSIISLFRNTYFADEFGCILE